MSDTTADDSGATDNVLPFPARPVLICTACGAQADAACTCNVAYLPAASRAAAALAADPGRSDRAIAEATGVGVMTVGRARKKAAATAPDGTVEKRIGKDGKERRLPNPALAIGLAERRSPPKSARRKIELELVRIVRAGMKLGNEEWQRGLRDRLHELIDEVFAEFEKGRARPRIVVTVEKSNTQFRTVPNPDSEYLDPVN